MMKTKNVAMGLVGVLALIFCVSTVLACPKDCNCAGKKAGIVSAGPGAGGSGSGGCGKPCHKGEGATTSDSEAVKAVLASMPAVKYSVGDKTLCCPNGASVAAKTENKPVEYVVGEEVFKTQSEADAKLVALYEKEIESMTALQFSVGSESTRCPETAKGMAEKSKGTIAYKVGGVEFSDKVKAEAAVKLVTDAASTVKMSYKVDGKSFCCDRMAGTAAKESGKPIVFVIGSDEIPEESAAKLLYAQAKIRAIVEAAAAAKTS